ncbi:crossover junction endodeoxyribonuclease RuvC [Brachyspira hampsonii]|uniref:Crossover junction endodeoxyribonuclease RuvC n=1 Tax=Brachyspira hampsonii TaxID=1287055 RepID=A0AAC9TUT3_9SPIR|nr:crossover junction endodeoxyribonuclease RuvC [Brachyspira hampsonii]ASJ21189.1 crossover junction endodeoxyribonuclease RuvC [Brachyspira hampsonii]ELV06592.1 Holliday junction resolvase [Brachyspira hampsonii 30599]MBW5379722.1 crossover junction endodeoxyribonuclease RuvC [Brachyspira hampsonii]MBW5408911.1 crossover junction endodeoxyribonuclease RuvC [Brachyspira hampsonii]OEJ17536.1 crossover junction endodeoxyribonuclease RuvC [Brachyspira hampsonii]
MITLGIDPGFARCGYAFIESKNSAYKIVNSGLIETFQNQEYNQRLSFIYTQLDALIKKYNPSNAAIEELFFSKNTKTAIKVAEARGVIILALTLNNIEFQEYKPKEVKSQITGNGNANKDAMMKMVNLFTGSNIIQDDTADAVAIALAHASRNRIFNSIK